MKLGMGFVVFTVSPVRRGGRSQGGCHSGLRKRRRIMFHLPIRDLRRFTGNPFQSAYQLAFDHTISVNAVEVTPDATEPSQARRIESCVSGTGERQEWRSLRSRVQLVTGGLEKSVAGR